MKACFLSAQLLLLSIILAACGSSATSVGTVTIDTPDLVVANVERAFNPKYYALYAMKETAPQTVNELAGRDWILCSRYQDASNNLMWLTQNAEPLKLSHFNLITGPKSKRVEMLSSCKDAFKTGPESILVIDRDFKFEFIDKMVELKLKSSQ